MNTTRPHFNPATEQPQGDLFVAKVTAVGAAAQDGTFPHAWQEQRFDPGSRAYVDMEAGGRVGTLTPVTMNPAYDLNKGSFAAGTYVYLRIRGRVNLGALPDGQDSGDVYDIVGC